MRAFLRFLMIFIFSATLLACSSPQSQERLKLIGCWLRPSCLPSDPSSPTPKPSQGSSPSPQSVSLPKSQPLSSPNPALANRSASCTTSARILIPFASPSIAVSYVEPTTKANGKKLTNLAKTTIYLDLGKGLVKYKDIKASNPAGGGLIEERIALGQKPEENLQATVCITATDTYGRES